MLIRRLPSALVIAGALAICTAAAAAGPASDALPAAELLAGRPPDAPIVNAAFAPGADAGPAPAFAGVLTISQAALQTKPPLEHPLIGGRDARLFPAVDL